MASNPSSRKTFIQSSIRLARSYNFLGLDLDWEYPSTPTDMANMGALFREWKTELRTESQSTGKTELLLSAAVFYSSDHYSVIYPVQSMATSLDWINVMSYDFYGPLWSGVTGPPAALFGGEVNGDNGISKWVQAGMPARKIVLGFPFYGYAWELEDERNHGYFTKTNGAAISEDGSIGYNQIRRWIVENDAATVYDGSVKGDYCYSGTTWIGYDDMQSIVEKVRYAKQRGLLGYFAWHVGIDDNWGLSKRG
ncbi:Glycosyl hydrolase family protein with chitinase insertion domain-containing protein [Senna tora]|uniref:Glycosyl hydrolase family protein with chitinase insertion domain-containing protein n=1 Tax=Senna tora TaxID=362788 RepID=A0A834SL76_9FABA|nr:Glycosyl hydrolase family protein with chitinase insertion domain-containing protein [Senna tora]